MCIRDRDDLARLAPPDRLRLRLTGRVKVNCKVEGAGGTTAESLPKVSAASAETARLAMQQFAANGIETSGKTPYVPSVDGEYDPRFSGEISLDGLRVNQLLLAPRLAGEIRASVEGVGMNARGRADEHFRFELENPASVPADGVAAEPAAEPPAPSVSMSIRRGLLNAAMEASDGRGDVRVAVCASTTSSSRLCAAASSARSCLWISEKSSAPRRSACSSRG